MKYSFFDMWHDQQSKPEDLPKHYETAHDYINHNHNKEEGWFKDEKDPYFNFTFTDEEEEEEYQFDGDDYPECVFGLKKSNSQEDMKKAYREAMLNSHPDKGGDAEEFRKYREAWEDYLCASRHS
jgi:DnaJ-class molecular chaperone